MITLTGNGLNSRHYELNKKVNDDAKNKLDFKQIENVKEQSDVDKLYKIDLASKYKNIDYILEVLKSGDSLHISRALKSDWIADDEYAHIMNPENLHNNIFPHMPTTMKKKLAAKLVSRIRNTDRAEQFHHYCMRNRMINFGMSFLLFTTDSFKMEILELHPHVYNNFNRSKDYLQYFIGNSFELAERYLKNVRKKNQIRIMNDLRSLYSVSQDQYLDLLESLEYTECHVFAKFSQRFSRDIMKKHKKRVLKHPLLYINILENKVVTKNSTSADAKVYAVAFLPAHVGAFWLNYYQSYRYFLDLIPLGERYTFVKKIFCEKYAENEFEDAWHFYVQKYYEMMTPKEQEDWALRQVASGRESHGFGNDYMWYKFVNFKTAFVELKKFILIANDNDKRTAILKIMIDSAKSQQEITKLLDYYYNRHINEVNDYKRVFINQLIESHKVLHFSEECWDALEKIFHSLEVFHSLSQDRYDFQNRTYRVLAFIYLVIHEKPVPEVFNHFIVTKNIIISSEIQKYLDKDVNQKQRDLLFYYMLRTYTDHVETLMKIKTNDINNVRPYIEQILGLIRNFKKTREALPVALNKLMMSNFEMFKYHSIFRDMFQKKTRDFNIKDIVSYLKKDASLVISEFPVIVKYIQDRGCKMYPNWLIRKLQVYFSHDLAQKYRNLLHDCLADKELLQSKARTAVHGILNLSDEVFISDFLKKYVPEDAKIDHVNICRNHLAIQTAICTMACKARPPLPVANVLEFIKGDYVKYCLPLFDSYMVYLTPPQTVTFVESLLDKPVSIQKHGLRLAFTCFSTENLKKLVLKEWKSMKNVSIRKILYKYLFDKINYHHDNPTVQWDLFEALTIVTHDINQDDDEEIFNLFTKPLPRNIFGQHLYSAYTIVNSFPKKPQNDARLAGIVREIEVNLELMSNHFLVSMMEEHIDGRDMKYDLDTDYSTSSLIQQKWSLVKTYIIKKVNDHILNLVMYKCLDKWYERFDGKYVFRRFWTVFLYDLESRSFCEPANRFVDINHIFIRIADTMKEYIKLKEFYTIYWKLHANILTRRVLGESNPNIFNDDMEDNLRNELITETIMKFSKEVGNLFKGIIDNEQYVPSLYSEVQIIIYKNASDVTRALAPYITNEDIVVLLCHVLLQYELVEMNKFVMKLIPSRYNGVYPTKYVDVINALKSIDDIDVEYFICHKFYCSDYEFRDFMP